MSLPFSGSSQLVYRRNRLVAKSLNPSTGTGAVTLHVLGSNFNGACVIYYDGAARATTFVSKSDISAPIAAGTAGAHTVEVRDAATGRKSSKLTFTAT